MTERRYQEGKVMSYEEGGEIWSGTSVKKSFGASGQWSKESSEERGRITRSVKHGWKSKGGPKYEIIEEEEHVFIIIMGERYELFEGEFYWYYVDSEGEKHYIAFERKREWVGTEGGKGGEGDGYDERWEAFEEEEAKLMEEERIMT